MSRAEVAAEAFLLGLLRRELLARGDEENASDPGKLIRLVPTEEEPLTAASGRAEGAVLVRAGVEQRLSDMTVELDGERGELLSWFLDFLAPEGDDSLPPDEALARCARVAAPPAGAKLELAGYEAGGGRTHYRARWWHEHEGLRVEGDFVEARLNGRNGQVFALTRRWRTPKLA